MLFAQEQIMIFHPGKCGGTTIENLFLRSLRETHLADLLGEPCFRQENDRELTREWVERRTDLMLGYLAPAYAVNGIGELYLQHADIRASLAIHGPETMGRLFKIAFVRNPFPRLLSAFHYNTLNRSQCFRDFVLGPLEAHFRGNAQFTVNHFGEMSRFTHHEGRRFVDFLGRLEHVAGDVRRLSALVGLPLVLALEPRHARTVAGELYEHYSQAYDDEMVDRVHALYREDFDLFDYRFERELPFRSAGG